MTHCTVCCSPQVRVLSTLAIPHATDPGRSGAASVEAAARRLASMALPDLSTELGVGVEAVESVVGVDQTVGVPTVVAPPPILAAATPV